MGVHRLYPPQPAVAEELGELNRVHPRRRASVSKDWRSRWGRTRRLIPPPQLGVAPEELKHSTRLKWGVLGLRVASGGHERMARVGVQARSSVAVDPSSQGLRERDQPLSIGQIRVADSPLPYGGRPATGPS